jgi:hypothetical protein
LRRPHELRRSFEAEIMTVTGGKVAHLRAENLGTSKNARSTQKYVKYLRRKNGNFQDLSLKI